MTFAIIAGGTGLTGIGLCCIVELARKTILRQAVKHGWRGKERKRRLREIC